jgi:hypothetical protein
MLSPLRRRIGHTTKDSASRAIPTTTIKMRNGLENATYSDKALTKEFIDVLLDPLGSNEVQDSAKFASV